MHFYTWNKLCEAAALSHAWPPGGTLARVLIRPRINTYLQTDTRARYFEYARRVKRFNKKLASRLINIAGLSCRRACVRITNDHITDRVVI